MGLHANVTGADIHSPFRQEFANAAARTGDATTYVAADVGKFAVQLDDNTLWRLSSFSPTTWTQVAVGSGSSPIAKSTLALTDADLTAAALTQDFVVPTVPANAIFRAWEVEVTTAMSGGGATNGYAELGPDAARMGNWGTSQGLSTTGLDNFVTVVPPKRDSQTAGATFELTPATATFRITSDVNLDTITAFAATFTVYWIDPAAV